jgi:hypothetical protein
MRAALLGYAGYNCAHEEDPTSKPNPKAKRRRDKRLEGEANPKGGIDVDGANGCIWKQNR